MAEGAVGEKGRAWLHIQCRGQSSSNRPPEAGRKLPRGNCG